MSYVTSVVIVTGYASPEFRAAVSQPSTFGRGGGAETSFAPLDLGAAGGTKYPSGDVFAAGLNYADRETLNEWLDALPWLDWGVVTIHAEGGNEEIRVYRAPDVGLTDRALEGPAKSWMEP